MNKMKKGDKIVVIAGKDKGKTGNILALVQDGEKFLVEGINIVKKHVKANPNANEPGGVVDKIMPIHRSNVMVYDDNEKKVTGGRNGYGAKLCNIFSTEFTVETADGMVSKKFKQTFSFLSLPRDLFTNYLEGH